MSKVSAVATMTAFLALLPGPVGLAQTSKPTPIRAMWDGIKNHLTGSGGQQYFQDILNEAELPTLEGTLISATPPDNPSVLVVGMSDPSLPEVTLRLRDEHGNEYHLNGPLMRGSQIRFEGVVKAFTQQPFMLTFDVSTELKTRPVPKR
jgi:hypothetical protein